MDFRIQTFQVFKTWKVSLFPDSDQEMEVVFQEAVGVGVGDGGDVFLVELQEVGIIARFTVDILASVAPVVDVEILAWSQCLFEI